jgi:hypothetical protein
MLAFCLTTAVVVGGAGFLIMIVFANAFCTVASRMGEARLDDLARSEPTEGSGQPPAARPVSSRPLMSLPW